MDTLKMQIIKNVRTHSSWRIQSKIKLNFNMNRTKLNDSDNLVSNMKTKPNLWFEWQNRNIKNVKDREIEISDKSKVLSIFYINHK